MSPSFVILSTYTNERTYASYTFTDNFAKTESARLRKLPGITKVVIEPYLGKTYFPAEIPTDPKVK